MSDLIIDLPDQLIKQLETIAQDQQITLNDVVASALMNYVILPENETEPTHEEIVQLVEDAVQKFANGELHTADEVLDRLEREMERHGD